MRRVIQISAFLLVTSCVEPIAFDIPSVSFAMVVDGSITNQPGPYTVRLTKANTLNQDQDIVVGISKATVTLRSDHGDNEVLIETEQGKYQTQTTHGVVGHSYWITIVTQDGVTYESDPETLHDAGELVSITPQFKDDYILVNGLEQNDDRFDILIDANANPSEENFMRWRATGTYAIFTFPEMIDSLYMGVLIPNPPPCSGWTYSVLTGLKKELGCTCCECWVTANERIPFVSDDALIKGAAFRNVNIGAVPVTRRTFYDKYHLTVDQIAHSKRAFDYFRLIRAQKDGAKSLFQPPSGKLHSNVHRVGSEEEVIGYFWAGGITSKSIFLTRDMVPYRVPFIDTLIIECNFVPNATVVKPTFWQ